MGGEHPEVPMERIQTFLVSIKLAYKRTPKIAIIIVSVAVVLSMAAILTLHGVIDATRRDTEELRQQAMELEQEQSLLKQYDLEKGTVREVIRIAMERLGLVEPDSVIIQPE